MMSKLATPSRFELGNILLRIVGDMAESACISPSTIKSGSSALINFRAARIFWDEFELRLPKLECDNKATLGFKPNRLTSSAALIVIFASASAEGSGVTCVSQINIVFWL